MSRLGLGLEDFVETPALIQQIILCFIIWLDAAVRIRIILFAAIFVKCKEKVVEME